MKKTPVLALGALALALSGCSSAEKPESPPYVVVDELDKENAHQVTVAVDSDDDLRAVFDAVIEEKANEDGGWYVTIVCGEDANLDGRDNIANGRHAIGSMGQAVTGLDDGESEFELVDGATCPA